MSLRGILYCLGKTAPQCSLFMLHTCMDMDGASLAQASHEMCKSPRILCRCRIRWSPTRRSELQTPNKVNGRGFYVEYQCYDVMYNLTNYTMPLAMGLYIQRQICMHVCRSCIMYGKCRKHLYINTHSV